MSTIGVVFEVPAYIVRGLADGSLERVGGVIRDSGTKQVVGWLREGGKITENFGAAQGFMTSILRGSGMSTATMGTVVTRAVPVLNVAMAGYTLYMMIARVKSLEAQIEETLDRVGDEFARDRQINLQTALANARDVIDAENDMFKHQAASKAIDQLYNTQHQIFHDFDTLFTDKMTFSECERAQLYLFQAMQVNMMRIRCYLETDQHSLAKTRLAESLEAYYERTYKLVRQLLGDHPAIYFHSSVTDEDFERYLNIERWLREKQDVVIDLVKLHRHDFWDNNVIKRIKDSPIVTRFNALIKRETDDDTSSHLLALTQAEILIENFNRLLGYELELASMRLEFDEWDTLADTEDVGDYVGLFDMDWLQTVERLSQY